jgi:hypothetical protein
MLPRAVTRLLVLLTGDKYPKQIVNLSVKI